MATPKWAGIIKTHELARADKREAFDLLNALAHAGMVQRKDQVDGFSYHLTWDALQYYFEGTEYGNNPEGLSFLCYSKLLPEGVLWNEPVHTELMAGVGTEVFRAGVKWGPGPRASWAEDAIIRSHSVMLVPSDNPIVVKFVKVGDDWETRYQSPMRFPKLIFVNPHVWPSSDTRTQLHDLLRSGRPLKRTYSGFYALDISIWVESCENPSMQEEISPEHTSVRTANLT